MGVVDNRGGAKTTQFARALLLKSLEKKCTILNCREYQTSIKNSVHAVYCAEIAKMGLDAYFDITNDKITSITGSIFIFAGICNNIENIKSIPNINYAWVEEASSVSQRSWDVLIPTIRGDNGNEPEIWISFNPNTVNDPVWKTFIEIPDERALVVKVGWQDNPWFPKVLLDEMEHLKNVDYEKYLNVWEGEPYALTEAVIFKGKFEVKEFSAPANADFLHGLDWGYSEDPMAFLRCYIDDGCLWIDYAVIKQHVEIDQYPAVLEQVPTAKGWKIYADSAQPGNISLLSRQGYNISPCKKYAGSIEDGITHLKNYRKIIIHPRCVELINEFKNYSWKIDKVSGDIQPIPVDKYNHGIDALRYSLTKHIIKKGTSAATWEKLSNI